jgi:phage-related protein
MLLQIWAVQNTLANVKFRKGENAMMSLGKKLRNERFGKRIADRVETYVATAGDKLDDAIDFVGSKSQTLKNSFGGFGSSLSEFGSSLKHNAGVCLREIHYKPLLIGVGTGFCLGMLIRRRVR